MRTFGSVQNGLSGRQRLVLEHVERGAADAVARERVDERRFVDQLSAADVDQQRVGRHDASSGAPMRPRVAASAAPQMTTTSAARQQIVQPFGRRRHVPKRSRRAAGRMPVDVGAEQRRTWLHRAADRAEADNQHARAGDGSVGAPDAISSCAQRRST